jgi:hypothetical protein
LKLFFYLNKSKSFYQICVFASSLGGLLFLSGELSGVSTAGDLEWSCSASPISSLIVFIDYRLVLTPLIDSRL